MHYQEGELAGYDLKKGAKGAVRASANDWGRTG